MRYYPYSALRAPSLIALSVVALTFIGWSLAPAAARAEYFEPNCPLIPAPSVTPAPVPTIKTQFPNRRAVVEDGSGMRGFGNPQAAVITQGENVSIWATPAPMVEPSGVPTPCPSPGFIQQFKALNVAADKYALVTVFTSPGILTPAINDASHQVKFNLATGNMISSTSTPIALSATLPTALIPASITAPSVPSGYVLAGYYALKIPFTTSITNVGMSMGFNYDTAINGDILFDIRTEVVGTASTRVVEAGGATTFRPKIHFSNGNQTNPAGTCMGPFVVQAIDGTGAPVNVLPGQSAADGSNMATIALSDAPANAFLDSGCLYQTSKIEIVNPAPSPVPAGQRPNEAGGPGAMQFYIRSTQAEGIPVTATYQEADGTELVQSTQVETIQPQIPYRLTVQGPGSVNQGACSSAFKIQLLDQYGNESPVTDAGGHPLALVGGGKAGFFLDPSCGSSAVSQIVVAQGSPEATFYVQDPNAELVHIQVSDNGTRGALIAGASADLHVLSLGTVAAAASPEAAQNLAIRLYNRLVGTPLNLTNPAQQSLYQQMSSLILQGKILQAAHLATAQADFYNVTMRNVATPLSNRLLNPLEPLNDFVATWIGIVRDDHDARELLTGNHVYVGASARTADDRTCSSASIYRNNDHYAAPGTGLDPLGVNLFSNLVPVRQCVYNTDNFDTTVPPVLLSDSAGLLTTHSWGINHLIAGTNRRALTAAFSAFLCQDIHQMADNTMPDWHVRRDVDRAPGGDPKVYEASCRSCHGGIDAMDGAFAFFTAYPLNANDSTNTQSPDFRMFYVTTEGYGNAVNPELGMAKENKNSQTFPAGWITSDDSWLNFFTDNQNQALGWDAHTPLKGNGVNQLGQMLANSAAFPSCMAQRAFKSLCKRAPADSEQGIINDLSQDFQASGYSMRRLYEKAASLSTCLGNGE